MMPSRFVSEGPVCAMPDQDPDLWFDVESRFTARDLCKGCRLRAECLLESLDLPTREGSWGVWGGMFPRQRLSFKVRYPNVTISYARELLDHIP